MKIISYLTLFGFVIALFACKNINVISKGNLSPNTSYTYSYYKYLDLSKNQKDHYFVGCRVYEAEIIKRDSGKMEKFVFYSCSPTLPVKITYAHGRHNKITDYSYLMSDLSTDALDTLTDNEKKLFEILDNKKGEDDYTFYSGIKGFKKPDSTMHFSSMYR